MPPILQTAQLPRRDRENPDAARFEADAGASAEATTLTSRKDGKLPKSRSAERCELLAAKANQVFPSVPLPHLGGEDYSYHNIYLLPIRLQSSGQLPAD
jgi:hypothetical protein